MFPLKSDLITIIYLDNISSPSSDSRATYVRSKVPCHCSTTVHIATHWRLNNPSCVVNCLFLVLKNSHAVLKSVNDLNVFFFFLLLHVDAFENSVRLVMNETGF